MPTFYAVNFIQKIKFLDFNFAGTLPKTLHINAHSVQSMSVFIRFLFFSF